MICIPPIKQNVNFNVSEAKFNDTSFICLLFLISMMHEEERLYSFTSDTDKLLKAEAEIWKNNSLKVLKYDLNIRLIIPSIYKLQVLNI